MNQRTYLLWGLGVAVVLVLAVVVLTPSESQVALDVRRSTLRTTPDGTAAFARSLEALGLEVEERFFSMTEQPPSGGVEALLEPLQGLSAGEAHLLLEWVREGGVLLYSPGFWGNLGDSVGLGASWQDPDEGETVLLPHRWTEGVPEPETTLPWGAQPDSGWTGEMVPLLERRLDDDRTLVQVAWLPMEEGGILFLADAAALSNQRLAESSHALVAARALLELAGPGGRVAFSEYHLGNDGRGTVLGQLRVLLLESALGRVAMYAGAVGVLLLLLGGVRFGAPVPVEVVDRRSPLEHVDALAGIYRSAGAHGTVARHLVQGAARRAGWSGTGDLAFLDRAQGRGGGEAVERARAALAATPPDLVALARALDELTHQDGTTP